MACDDLAGGWGMKAGWQIKKLGDICDFEGGSQPPKAEFIYQEAVDYVRFLQIRDFGSDKNITYVRHSKKNRLCSENDILIGRYGASVGKILSGKAGAYNVALMKTIPNQEIVDRSWFHKFLISDDFQHPLLNVADRSAQAGFSKDDIYNFPVPIPPLTEQQRIVTFLDEAFDGIATAKAHAEKNLRNARAIFESHVQSVFTDKAKEWPDRLLGDVFHIGSSKRIYETDWTIEGIPFYGGREIVKLAKYGSTESASFISEEKYKEYASKYEMPQAGEILMTARGTIGVGYIVKPGDKFYYKDGNVISLRAKSPTNPQFVLYAFRSNAILDQLTVLVGTTVSHLPIEKAKMLKICLPTFEVQNFIVEHLELMEAHSKDLESIYQRKLTALDELKKSLLHRAFNGDL